MASFFALTFVYKSFDRNVTHPKYLYPTTRVLFIWGTNTYSGWYPLKNLDGMVLEEW